MVNQPLAFTSFLSVFQLQAEKVFICGYSEQFSSFACNFKLYLQFPFCHVTAPIGAYSQVPEMSVWPQDGSSSQSKSNVKNQAFFAAISPARSSRAQCLVHFVSTSSLCAELYEVPAPASAHLIPAISSFSTALYSDYGKEERKVMLTEDELYRNWNFNGHKVM